MKILSKNKNEQKEKLGLKTRLVLWTDGKLFYWIFFLFFWSFFFHFIFFFSKNIIIENKTSTKTTPTQTLRGTSCNFVPLVSASDLDGTPLVHEQSHQTDQISSCKSGMTIYWSNHLPVPLNTTSYWQWFCLP